MGLIAVGWPAVADAAVSPQESCDFNNDGYDDLAVGIPDEDIGAISSAGAVNVLYGANINGPSGTTGPGAQLFYQGFNGVHGFAEADDRFGEVITCGDLNDDGYSELIVGVPNEDLGFTNSGVVHVLYGGTNGLIGTARVIITMSDTALTDTTNAYLGSALAVGNFDDDARNDLAIGARGAITAPLAGSIKSGAVVIKSGWAIAGCCGYAIFPASNSIEAGMDFGASLAAADFTWDARDNADLAIGAPNKNLFSSVDAGSVYLHRGGFNGTIVSQTFVQAIVNQDGIAPFERFGSDLAAGNIDGIWRNDLVVSFNDSIGGGSAVGAVTIFESRSTITPPLGLGSTGPNARHYIHQGNDSLTTANEGGDEFGYALAVADFNGDNFEDLAIGVPGENVTNVGGEFNHGRVQVVYGAAGGPWGGEHSFSQFDSWVFGAGESRDEFGFALAVGDFNSVLGRWHDLMITTPKEEPLGTNLANSGWWSVHYGKNGTLVNSTNEGFSQDTPGVPGVSESGDQQGTTEYGGHGNGW